MRGSQRGERSKPRRGESNEKSSEKFREAVKE
jgi:hypothetical protein